MFCLEIIDKYFGVYPLTRGGIWWKMKHSEKVCDLPGCQMGKSRETGTEKRKV